MKNNLGEIIQLNREKSGLSVRDLAKLSGINHTYVSKLEKNKIQKPSIKTLVSLSNVLNINLLAIYLEDSERYLYYQPIIESCSDLTKTQQEAVLEYIQQIEVHYEISFRRIVLWPRRYRLGSHHGNPSSS